MKSLLKFENQLARNSGRSIRIDGKMDSVVFVRHFLRAFRGRADLADVMPSESNSFLEGLESVRTAIALGDINRAEILVSRLHPEEPLEAIEAALEECRIFLFKNDMDHLLCKSEEILR